MRLKTFVLCAAMLAALPTLAGWGDLFNWKRFERLSNELAAGVALVDANLGLLEAYGVDVSKYQEPMTKLKGVNSLVQQGVEKKDVRSVAKNLPEGTRQLVSLMSDLGPALAAKPADGGETTLQERLPALLKVFDANQEYIKSKLANQKAAGKNTAELEQKLAEIGEQVALVRGLSESGMVPELPAKVATTTAMIDDLMREVNRK